MLVIAWKANTCSWNIPLKYKIELQTKTKTITINLLILIAVQRVLVLIKANTPTSLVPGEIELKVQKIMRNTRQYYIYI